MSFIVSDVKALVILQQTVETRKLVSSVHVHIVNHCTGAVKCVHCRGAHPSSSSKCAAFIKRHEILTEQHTECNNFSTPAATSCGELHIDVILLQEIWQPPEGLFTIRNFSAPLTKIRTGKVGGGVAIVAHKHVRSVHLIEYEVDGLEAVWAEVGCGKVRTVVGSIYIPPGNIAALELLDDVISRILQNHSKLAIYMDANARNAIWDNSYIGISQSRHSIKMGSKLEQIIDKHELLVHNNGSATYFSGDSATAQDVTITTGLTHYGNIDWTILDDDLRTPHEGIMHEVGAELNEFRKEVINWRSFDWARYREITATALKDIIEHTHTHTPV